MNYCSPYFFMFMIQTYGFTRSALSVELSLIGTLKIHWNNFSTSQLTQEDVTEVLSVVSYELHDLGAKMQVLFDMQHLDVANAKELSQSLEKGLVLYQYEERNEALPTMLALAAVEGMTLVLVLCTSINIRNIFQMIQKKRLNSHFARWVLLVQGEEEDLSEVFADLSGLVTEGTRVSILFKESSGEFSLFSSSTAQSGIIRFFPAEPWNKERRKAHENPTTSLIFPDEKDIYEDMAGRELKVGANEFEGYLRLNPKPKEKRQNGGKGRQRVYGIDGELLYALSLALNFTYRLVSPADGYWGNPLPNGTVTGIIGLNARRETHMAICAISITVLRDTVVDYTHPYVIEPLALFSRAPRQKNKVLAVLSPFQFEVWLSLFFTTLVMGPLLNVIKRVSRSYLMEKPKWGLELASFNTFRSMVTQGNKLKTRHWPLRFIFISWYLFCLIVAALYTGMLTAVLAIPAYEKPIDGLLDLPRAAKNGFSVGCLKQTSTESLLRTAESGIYRETWLLFDHNNLDNSLMPSIEVGIRKVMQEKFVFIGFKISNELLVMKHGRTKFYIGKQDIFPLRTAIVCPSGAPYINAFNAKLLRLIEGGIISKWRADEFMKVSRNETMVSEDDSKTYAISLVHIQAALFLLLLGLLIAASVLLLESIISNNKEIK